MINIEEHIYHDDPRLGHVDVRTRLKDVSYFFLGNGHIQMAIQYAPSGEGTPLGAIIMNPDELKPKRDSLSFDATSGLEKTMLAIKNCNTESDVCLMLQNIGWDESASIPTVKASWLSDGLKIDEWFYCPDFSNATVVRHVKMENQTEQAMDLTVNTGIPGKTIDTSVSLNPGQRSELYIQYALYAINNSLDISWTESGAPSRKAIQYWENVANIKIEPSLLASYFKSSSAQLAGMISQTGRVDASIWQYNLEWVRDHSFMALGLVLSGHHEIARIVLDRLIDEFVSDEGGTFDSSEQRDPEDAELDQNGTLLYVLNEYVLWTGDLELVGRHWDKITKIAEYPFSGLFQHEKSGLFHNSREYWERHRAFGIEDGFELMYQFFVSIGISAAASLAHMLNKDEESARWDKLASELKNTILHHPEYAMVDERGFIKRRGLDGHVQETITPVGKAGLPDAVPLISDSEHFLNPDTSSALPIALGFVAPDSEVAQATMQHLEVLWNQCWDDGGYGRYHKTSEPDSHGAWPFASLFIARAAVETGDYATMWKILDWLSSTSGAASGSWFEMYGPRISPPYAQVGIPPWTWGEMIVLVIQHILGIHPQPENIVIRPRIIPGLKNIACTIPIRGNKLHIKYRVDDTCSEIEINSDAEIIEQNDQEILLPFIKSDILIEMTVPPRQ